MFIVLLVNFLFFPQLEISHCLLTDQIIIMADTLVQPSNKTIDMVFPAASISIFYKIRDLFLHSACGEDNLKGHGKLFPSLKHFPTVQMS